MHTSLLLFVAFTLVIPVAAQPNGARAQAPVSAAARIEQFEQGAAKGRPDHAELNAIAWETAREARQARDVRLRVAACSSDVFLMDDCLPELRQAAADATLPFSSRVEAAAALLRRKAKGAAETFTQVMRTADTPLLLSALEPLSRAPAEHRLPWLISMARSTDERAQEAAARALGGIQHPDSLTELERLSRVAKPGESVWFTVVTARARHGTPEALAAAGGIHRYLEGENLLEAGRAFAAAGDPRGVALLLLVTRSPGARVQVRAAEQLLTLQADPARAVLERALQHRDGQVRAEALDAYRASAEPMPPNVPRMMLDADPIVRLRAAELAALWVARQPRN